MNEQRADEIWDDGYAAFSSGAKCPWDDESAEWELWQDGWEAAESEQTIDDSQQNLPL